MTKFLFASLELQCHPCFQRNYLHLGKVFPIDILQDYYISINIGNAVEAPSPETEDIFQRYINPN